MPASNPEKPIESPQDPSYAHAQAALTPSQIAAGLVNAAAAKDYGTRSTLIAQAIASDPASVFAALADIAAQPHAVVEQVRALVNQ